LQSKYFPPIFFYFEKGNFGVEKFTLQKSELTLQRRFLQRNINIFLGVLLVV
jgi:hypothetical protein